jgi:hypothetical protein
MLLPRSRPVVWAVSQVSMSTRASCAFSGAAQVQYIYLGPYWQAIVREETGQTIITRHNLKGLLDKLETLDRDR